MDLNIFAYVATSRTRVQRNTGLAVRVWVTVPRTVLEANNIRALVS